MLIVKKSLIKLREIESFIFLIGVFALLIDFDTWKHWKNEGI